MTKVEVQALRAHAESSPGWATTRITNAELLHLLNRLDSIERQLAGQKTVELPVVTDAAIAQARTQFSFDANGGTP